MRVLLNSNRILLLFPKFTSEIEIQANLPFMVVSQILKSCLETSLTNKSESESDILLSIRNRSQSRGRSTYFD